MKTIASNLEFELPVRTRNLSPVSGHCWSF